MLASSTADYWSDRRQFIMNDTSCAIGASLELTPEEKEVNKILMKLKFQEYDNAYKEPSTFLPAQHFFIAKDKIEKSKVFKFIQEIPKGASLHSHATALVSSDFVYNLTFSQDLYACIVNNRLKLHFFNDTYKDTSCAWKTLDVFRKEMPQFDKYLKSQLTIIREAPEKVYEDINDVWKVFAETFQTVTPMITYKPVFKKYFRQALLELYEDNVKYLEFRSDLSEVYDLDGNQYKLADIMQLYKDTLKEFMIEYPDFKGARFIYGPQRSVNNKTAETYINHMKNLIQAHPDFVVGFDLVGQEDPGRPLYSFVNVIKQLPPHIKFFFHAGETNWYGTASDMNLIDAVILGATRIGHGFAITKHPFVMEQIKKQNIAIEVCPISNQVLKLVNDLRNHPASQLIAEGFPVVICNDDPSFWGSKGLSYDWYMAFMGIAGREADLKFLKQIANNSLTYSSMPEAEKKIAIAQWEQDWANFVKEILVKNTSAFKI